MNPNNYVTVKYTGSKNSHFNKVYSSMHELEQHSLWCTKLLCRSSTEAAVKGQVAKLYPLKVGGIVALIGGVQLSGIFEIVNSELSIQSGKNMYFLYYLNLNCLYNKYFKLERSRKFNKYTLLALSHTTFHMQLHVFFPLCL